MKRLVSMFVLVSLVLVWGAVAYADEDVYLDYKQMMRPVTINAKNVIYFEWVNGKQGWGFSLTDIKNGQAVFPGLHEFNVWATTDWILLGQQWCATGTFEDYGYNTHLDSSSISAALGWENELSNIENFWTKCFFGKVSNSFLGVTAAGDPWVHLNGGNIELPADLESPANPNSHWNKLASGPPTVAAKDPTITMDFMIDLENAVSVLGEVPSGQYIFQVEYMLMEL